jgi:hypothetical protein
MCVVLELIFPVAAINSSQVRSTWSKYFAKYPDSRAEAYLCEKYDRPVTSAEIAAALANEPVEVEDMSHDATSSLLPGDKGDVQSDSNSSDSDSESVLDPGPPRAAKSTKLKEQNLFLEITSDTILAQMDKGNMV